MSTLFLIIYIIWFLTEILLSMLLRSKSTDKQHKDKNSLSMLWISIVLSVFVAVYLAKRFDAPIYTDIQMSYVGLGIIVLGIVLRLIAVRSLGPFFTVDVTIREGHTIKKDGFYRYLRHPSYAASILSFIGFGFSMNSWPSLILLTVVVFVIFIIRMNIEEKVLTEQFGQEYVDYMKTTKRVIPFVY